MKESKSSHLLCWKKSNMPLKVFLDQSPLSNGHAIRGIGMYTRFLHEALQKDKSIELVESAKEAQVIHYPFFDLFSPSLPLFSKTRTIVTIHDVIPLLFPKYYPLGKKARLNFFRQKLALRKVDAVITDSEASKIDIAKHLRVPLDKIKVVYLAGNPQIQAVSETIQSRVRRKYKLPQRFLLYVGDINYNKNLPQLIKALKFLPEQIKLVMVGKNFREQDIPEWQRIQVQIALSSVAKRVKFINNLDTRAMEDLSAIYSMSLAYVQPSLYEGFGLPVLEAMACRTPVICHDNSSLGEIVLNKAILSNSATAEDFAQSVEEVLTWSQAKRDEFTKKAKRYAASFTWRKTAQNTIKVYEKE
jgi:glycosyltransferase involved in cell wall biosynthesis